MPQQRVTILILPLGNNTWVPNTLDIATIKIIGAIIWDGKIDSANFTPHNVVIRQGAQNINPTVIGIAIANVKSGKFSIEVQKFEGFQAL